MGSELIQAIVDNAPAEAGNYHLEFKQYYGGTNARNLNDLREILALRKEVAELKAKLATSNVI